MKKLCITLLAALSLAACQQEVKQMKFTDVGPVMTIQSVDGSAYMGGNIAFQVNLSDAEFTLSTLKVELLFDETVVNTVTIRTKEYGTYDDVIAVPLYANIPDGVATLRFTAQNTGLGLTVLEKDVTISRPNVEAVYITVDGNQVALPKVADYQYSLTAPFPANATSLVTVPTGGEDIVLGWSGSAIKVDGDPIPFKMGAPGVYTISVNLMDLTASPFGKLSIDLSESKTSGVYNLVPNTTMIFPSIPTIGSWELDYDFFNVTKDGVVTFKAVSGLYKLDVNFSKKYILVEAMEDENTRATLSGEKAQAIWVIGGTFGKPSIGPSWNTTDGAYCLSQVEPGIHQLTLAAGSQLGSGFSIKFFHQKGWGGEFGSYATVNDETGLFKVTGSGNIEAADGKSLEDGMGYQFTVDLTGGADAAALSIREVKLSEGLDIRVNGVKAKGSGDVYKVSLVELTQGGDVTISGEVGLNGYVPDPDFIANGKFNAVSGNYSVELHLNADKTDVQYAIYRRVDAEGKNVNLGGGGCYIQGGNFSLFYHTKEIGWPGTGGLQMAQVSPGVFQVSGYAVQNGDDKTAYGRWQVDAMNVKYFYQDGWGGEASKDHTLTDRAAKLLSVTRGDAGNIYLLEDVTLEEGAFYVMTVDFTGCTISGAGLTSGTEVIDFYKK
jgi:hypothetical protein